MMIPFNPTVTGSQFLAMLPPGPGQVREDLIVQYIKAGNCPEFLQNWVEVPVADNACIYVFPDYLCVGTSEDYVRTPMWPLTAQRIADALGCILPTRKMVNKIWEAATIKLNPQPWGPPFDADMELTHRWGTHNQRIEDQKTQGYPNASLGELVVGHKKDVVISASLQKHPDRVFIYGWHYLDGKPIQPLSWIHANRYSDYSHGIRMVSSMMTIDGQEFSILDVASDPNRCSLISDEGPLSDKRIPGV